MFKLLIDTCVWLDIAKDPDLQAALSVLEELVETNEVGLLLPRVILDEFERNKARVVEESGRSLSSIFKRVKQAVDRFGDPKNKKLVLKHLNDVDYKVPTLGAAAFEAISRIDDLFKRSTIIELSDAVKLRSSDRALNKKAPFHRDRNSMADAILVETYSECLQDPRSKGIRFAFITHNTKDFSDPAGDQRDPHPDLSGLFSKVKSLYFIKLAQVLHRIRPALVSERMIEEEWHEEPRALSDIGKAIEELLDKVWYNRHQVTKEKLQHGEITLVDKEQFPVLDHAKRPVQRDVWDTAKKAAKKVEDRYGRRTLGPWTDFDWGMLNGKLSALRWVVGDEWDNLDT